MIRFAKIKEKIINEITCKENSNQNIALSLALGLLIALSPAWGFQTILAISLAALFRLNKVLALITVNISSIPPLIPIVILGGYQVGFFLFNGYFQTEVPDLSNLKTLGENYLQFALGSLVVACCISSLFYGIVLLIVRTYRN